VSRRREQGNRAEDTVESIRAAYAQHKSDQHGGTVGRRCSVCARYLAGVVRVLERDAVRTASPAAPPTADPTADRMAP